MTYKEIVKLVLDKVLELNSKNIEITMSKDQLTCWFVDGACIQDSIDIQKHTNNTYEISYWDKDNYRDEITVDEMFEMITKKEDK